MMVINDSAGWVRIGEDGMPPLARLIVADNIPVGRIVSGSDGPDPAAWVDAATWFQAETKVTGIQSTAGEFPVRATYEEALADLAGNLVGLPAVGITANEKEASVTINESDLWLVGRAV